MISLRRFVNELTVVANQYGVSASEIQLSSITTEFQYNYGIRTFKVLIEFPNGTQASFNIEE